MHSFYTFSLLLATISNSVLIGFLFKRAINSQILSAYIVLVLLVNAWAIPQLILNNIPVANDYFIQIDKISAIGYIFIPLALIKFALAYTNRSASSKRLLFIFLIYMPSIIFLYLAWNTNFIESRNVQEVKSFPWGYAVPTGPLFPILLIWFQSVSFYSVYTIIQMYRKTHDIIRKKQSFLLIIAFLIPLLFGAVTNGILPAFHMHTLPIAIPLTSITAVIIAYAIYKYGLFEVTSAEILSSIGNGVITINKQKEIIHINNYALALLGLENKNLIDKVMTEVFSIRSDPQSISKDERFPIPYVLRTGEKIKSHDFILRTKQKKTFPIECTITPIIQDNNVIGATIIFRDTTKEKIIEQSKNEFISIASHELKTPLTSVIAFSQILESRMEKRKDKLDLYFIHSINEQLHKIKSLIEDLLNISRMESGMFVLNKVLYPIDTLIDKTIQDMQYTTDTHTLMKIGKTNKKVSIDIDRINQVLVNLISNAVKYSPKANKVTIRVREIGKDIVVSVQDFGIGIPKKDQKKIFKRFYRTRKSQHSKISGFGLGLYICAEIIKNHNGRIWVESIPGKSSTFSFSLPITK